MHNVKIRSQIPAPAPQREPIEHHDRPGPVVPSKTIRWKFFFPGVSMPSQPACPSLRIVFSSLIVFARFSIIKPAGGGGQLSAFNFCAHGHMIDCCSSCVNDNRFFHTPHSMLIQDP